MGLIYHHAIVVTCPLKGQRDTIAGWVEGLHPRDQQLFMFTPATYRNGYYTVAMCPDGGKEGWEPSNYYDELRARFIAFLQGMAYTPSYVEVGFGEMPALIINTHED